MQKGERVEVFEYCEHCGTQTKKTVLCSEVDNGMETRLYICNECGSNEDRNVPHNETLHDKIRRQQK